MAKEVQSNSSWKLNITTAVAYVANTVVTYLSQTGIFGYTNQELSLKYQTLVTPKGFAFAIWGVIFLLQGVFSVAQLFPSLRQKKEVVEGVNYWYVSVCVFQCAWTIAFAQDIVWLSLVFMLGIWTSLTLLAQSLCTVHAHKPPTWTDYLLFYAPFLMHYGWVTAASVLNVNVTLVAYDGGAHVLLLTSAIISLVPLVLLGVYNPFVSPTGVDGVFSAVISWALYGIGSELKAPEKKIGLWCPPLVTDSLSLVCFVLAAALLVVTSLRLVFRPKMTVNTDPNPLLSNK